MKLTKTSLAAQILLATLATQFLCVVVLVGSLLFGAKENAQIAFDSGRFVKIDVKTAQIEGNLVQTAAVPPPEKAINELEKALPEKALSEEEYRLKRIKELTGQEMTTQELVQATPLPSPPVVLQPTEAVKMPLNLEIPAELVEKRGKYLLPKPFEKLIPWQYYAKPSPATEGKRTISIIITNLGLNDEATRQAMQLDENVTLAFSPYAPNLAMQIANARRNGFEAWLNLPLQHENYPVHDYGNLTLLNELTPKQNIALLHRTLNNTNGVVGLVALPDEKYSASPQMLELSEEIKARGLLLALYSSAFTPASYEQKLLTHLQPHINGGNIPSDLNQLFASLEAQTQNTENLKISIAAMPSVMQALQGWIAQLPAKNIVLTPLSSDAAHAYR